MTPYRFTGSVGTAACIIIIPLVDTLRIVILRISKRQSPFMPDKSHIHHAILRLGMTHSQTTLILAGVQTLFISLAIVFNQFGDLYVVSGLLILSFLLSFTLDRLIINRLSD
jgi:UDP-GlcNAc:undecaprenyl-phosphate GlcNAc-1-phosphate transferase